MTVSLLCTVRGCRRPLVDRGRNLVCAEGHAFDRARSGYVNLLQPQERRSRQPGDSAEAIAARRRLFDRGIAEPLLAALVEVAAISRSSRKAILDVGCGEGYYLDGVSRALAVEGHGIDIATTAIDLASRRYPDARFVVGNADRQLPYPDDSFRLAMSITGRLNASESARVSDWLMVAVAAPDDLAELRGGQERDRIDRTVTMFRDHFELVESRRASTRAALDADGVRDLLASTYRPREAAGRDVTLSLDVMLFRRL